MPRDATCDDCEADEPEPDEPLEPESDDPEPDDDPPPDEYEPPEPLLCDSVAELLGSELDEPALVAYDGPLDDPAPEYELPEL